MNEEKLNDSFKGWFSNNYIVGFDFDSLHEPLLYQRADGTIVANMDGCAIMPKKLYLELTAEKGGRDEH